MPRIRTIKPDYPHSYRLTEVNRDARYLNLLLRTLADDRGRLELNPVDLAKRLFPGDNDAPLHLLGWLYELQDIEAIELYQVDKIDYIRILRWDDEQTICHPTPSVLPASPNETPDDSRISRNSTRRRTILEFLEILERADASRKKRKAIKRLARLSGRLWKTRSVWGKAALRTSRRMAWCGPSNASVGTPKPRVPLPRRCGRPR